MSYDRSNEDYEARIACNASAGLAPGQLDPEAARWRERAWRAESLIEQRQALRRELEEILGMDSRPASDEVFQEGMNRLRNLQVAVDRATSLLNATPQSLRLQFGELSAQEIRTIRAVLEYVAGEVEVKPTAERQNAADAAPTPRDARRLAAGLITEIEQSGSSSVIEKLEQAIVNIYRWTGSRRVARECRRVLPDVVKRERKPNDQAH